jgi:hypothetical protein
LARPHRGREELAVQQVPQGSSRRDVNVHQAAATSMQSALVLLVLRACATPTGSTRREEPQPSRATLPKLRFKRT